MGHEVLTEHLDSQVTRRRIVETGVKLAYAAPLVAATFKLTEGGVLAAQVCTCGCTTGGPWEFDPATRRCRSLRVPPPTFECTDIICVSR